MTARMRSMMAGMTDYTGVPLDDIVSHLRDWRDGTADTIKNLRGLNERVKVEKARLDGPTDILRYLDFFIDLFSRYLVDFERLLPELPENVSDAHIEMVRQIYDSSRQEDRTCVSFKQEHIERGLKDESLRPLVDNVYQETRGMIIDYRDLSNLIPRLRTFVGIAPNTGAKADRRFAEMAIQEALKSLPEDDRPHPLVGAVVVKNGVVVSLAHRGENPKCHAEYIALEEKLSDDLIAGATVYTTLEPCTTRNHPKIPCADRLIERKVARVLIGMLDPNPEICGRGWQLLREAGIVTQMFDHDLMLQCEEMNRTFTRAQK